MYDDIMHGNSTTPKTGPRPGRLGAVRGVAPHWIAELVFCLVIGALLSLAYRTDANWDLQNYHLYAPFAALHGRLGLDYFAAGFQGYLNPLQDMPYLLARTALFDRAPRLLALCAGLPFGCLAFIVFRLAATLIEDRWGAIFAALIGLTGATTLSEIGTTFDDILTGCVVLPALLAIVGRWRHAAAIAGGLCGFAIALKLTAVMFVVPLAGAIVIMAPAPRAVLANAWRFALAATLAFALGYGWWGVLLWRQFHDPVFPLLSGLFHARLAPHLDPRDTRFLPRSLAQWIAYPFYWIEGRSFVVTEMRLRDPRFALAWLAAVSPAVTLTVGALRRRTAPLPPPARALWWFMIVSYVTWLPLFSILRYALPLEVCTGIMVATALRQWLPARAATRVTLAILLVCLAVTEPMEWGRIAYGQHLVQGRLPVLPAGAVVLMRGAPIGFVATHLAAPGNRFVNLAELATAPAEQRIVRRLIGAAAPAFLLTNLPVAGAAPGLRPYGLTVDPSRCRPIRTATQRAIRLCALGRRGG
ncbi:MAG TPA: hypothetical protein PK435_15680 [Thermoanaerobaculaceae bacterium]|nr:hypothetical protein [Thermoanaerobaculaceae bacterium]